MQHGPGWKYVAFWYLKCIKKRLTEDWALIQGGQDDYAMQKWIDIFVLLEVDLKAQTELMILAQSGPVGRTCANKFLWDMLSIWCLRYDDQDLSRTLSSEVGQMRLQFDSPPP